MADTGYEKKEFVPAVPSDEHGPATGESMAAYYRKHMYCEWQPSDESAHGKFSSRSEALHHERIVTHG